MIHNGRHLFTRYFLNEFGQKFLRVLSDKKDSKPPVKPTDPKAKATQKPSSPQPKKVEAKKPTPAPPKKVEAKKPAPAPPKKAEAKKPAPAPPKKAEAKKPAPAPPKKAEAKKPAPPPPPPPKKEAPPKPARKPGPLIKDVNIYRYDPNSPTVQRLQTYKFDLNRLIGSAPMVLTMLIMIKDQDDGTLTFRRSCREGICGSCGINVDGVNTLACISMVNMNASKPMFIYPMPSMYVVKDLVVDLDHFYAQYSIIKPWLKRK